MYSKCVKYSYPSLEMLYVTNSIHQRAFDSFLSKQQMALNAYLQNKFCERHNKKQDMITRNLCGRFLSSQKRSQIRKHFRKSPIIAINTNVTRCYKNSKGCYHHNERIIPAQQRSTGSWQFNIFGKQLFVISHNNKLRKFKHLTWQQNTDLHRH